MPRRIIVFVALAVASAALFVRLGFWQLSRLSERRARNAETRARQSEPEAPFDRVPRDSSGILRHVVVTGTPDVAAEFVVTGRSRNGSPGVHIVTPVRPAGADSQILVNRGWVYAPDAATIDLARWREARASFRGYVQVMQSSRATTPAAGRAVRALDTAAAARMVPDAMRGRYVVAQDSGAVDSTPARLPSAALDDGPHLSYAIQWFCFAAIAVVGAAIVVRRSRDSALGTRRETESRVPSHESRR